MIVELNEDNFQQQALASDIPVLVDFWAEWCGPCKVLSPLVEEIGREHEGKLKIGKVNVDDNNNLAMRYGVMSIPTLKVFKGGQLVGEMVGAAPKNMIEAMLAPHLS